MADASSTSSPTIVIPVVAGIGNALMAEPAVRQLRAGLPRARVVVLAMIAPMAAVFGGIAGVETIVTGRGMKNLLRGVRTTRGVKPDVYLIPFPSNRWQYNALATASGARRVILHGYPVGRFSALGFLHNDRVPADRGLHDVVQNLRLLEPLGLNPDYADVPRFTPTPAEAATAEATLRDMGLCEGPFVAVHAGSAKTILATAKRWPGQKYAQLVQAIARETRQNVLIVEGPDEAGVTQDIVQHCENLDRIHTLKLVGPLGESAAVLARSSFYVGTDSGLAHLTAAVGRRAVTLFAPADPDRVCPAGQRDLVVQPPDGRAASFLYPYQATKPKLPPEELGRINTITVEQVMAKVQQAAGNALAADGRR
ncbi:MAG TPA: glycosyltransferase family 9 protein [Tepidisphaeraceae bacterium]|jgi:heptosyltransferase-2